MEGYLAKSDVPVYSPFLKVILTREAVAIGQREKVPV